MILYGRNPVREALRGPRNVKRVWATQATEKEPWLRELTAGIQLDRAAGAELESLAGTPDHQGVAATTRWCSCWTKSRTRTIWARSPASRNPLVRQDW
jgi:tRNA G18 (ribose-2'-O)-methylase SpoU